MHCRYHDTALATVVNDFTFENKVRSGMVRRLQRFQHPVASRMFQMIHRENRRTDRIATVATYRPKKPKKVKHTTIYTI